MHTSSFYNVSSAPHMQQVLIGLRACCVCLGGSLSRGTHLPVVFPHSRKTMVQVISSLRSNVNVVSVENAPAASATSQVQNDGACAMTWPCKSKDKTTEEGAATTDFCAAVSDSGLQKGVECSTLWPSRHNSCLHMPRGIWVQCTSDDVKASLTQKALGALSRWLCRP